MKKLISLVLAALCMVGLLGCSNKETKVWDWAQGLTQESILAATPWRHDEDPRVVLKLEIVVLEEFHPPTLSHVQFHLIKQVLETLVVAKYFKLCTI